MFALTLTLAERTRHYSIAPVTGRGWEIRIEEHSDVRRLDDSDDWHRVERALQRFAQEASALRADGWLVVEAQSMKR